MYGREFFTKRLACAVLGNETVCTGPHQHPTVLAMSEASAWVSTRDIAARLGISTRTLFNYQKRGDLFTQGRHFRRSTPSPASPWVWEADLTVKAWLAEVGNA